MTSVGTAWSKLRSFLLPRALVPTRRPVGQQAPSPERAATAPAPHPFDQRHGVDTGGFVPGTALRSGHPHDAFNTAYYGMAPSRFHWIMEQWIADHTHARVEDYSFLDLGCGKGRALMLASQYGFRQIVGVELHSRLAKIARANVARWKTRNPTLRPIRVLRRDATELRLPCGPCLLYLFHPFAAPVVQRLIERIESQFAGRPAALDIIYFNPEAGDLFQAHPDFELLWTGNVPLSAEDRAADTLAFPGDLCSVYRWTGPRSG